MERKVKITKLLKKLVTIFYIKTNFYLWETHLWKNCYQYYVENQLYIRKTVIYNIILPIFLYFKIST